MSEAAIAYLKKREDQLRRQADTLNREADAVSHAIMMIERAAIDAEEVPQLIQEVTATTMQLAPRSLNASHNKVLGQLREVARGGIAEMPIKSLARLCNMAHDSARLRLDELEAAGFITEIRHGRGSGASRYQMLKGGLGGERAA